MLRAALAVFVGVVATACGNAGTGGIDGGHGSDASWPDAVLPDGRVIGGPYATRVVSFDAGANAGFGQQNMPSVVLGPPVGAGDMRGGTDVVSLGQYGSICLAFDDVTIVDGPGPDFVVFENPFEIAGTTELYAELGQVSVSDDGVNYVTYGCDTMGPPYPGCAGWHPVYSNPTNGIRPDDVDHAGGDPFDLADVGLTHVRYVCIHDLNTQNAGPPAAGFDLDAIAAVNWE